MTEKPKLLPTRTCESTKQMNYKYYRTFTI